MHPSAPSLPGQAEPPPPYTDSADNSCKQAAKNNDKKSEDDRSSTSSIENITISVPTEQGTSVELCLKVYGLKAKSTVTRWFYKLGKPESPECLVSNARVITWQGFTRLKAIGFRAKAKKSVQHQKFVCCSESDAKLTSTSLKVLMHVKTDRKAAKKNKQKKQQQHQPESTTDAATTSLPDELPPGWEQFKLNIKQFPSELVAEHCSFTIAQPSGRDYSFIMMELKKKDASCSWQQFLRDNGTIDVTQM